MFYFEKDIAIMPVIRSSINAFETMMSQSTKYPDDGRVPASKDKFTFNKRSRNYNNVKKIARDTFRSKHYELKE